VVEDRTIIESGVSPGERVVTDGQMRLVPGSRVEIKGGSANAVNTGATGSGL
jgi:multidrug efflux system membrane fusion protein